MVEVAQKGTKRLFFAGVLSLSLSTVLVKVIGLIYKIPMLSFLGAEGMGYFNSAYEIYALFCVISTAGLPVALSVLISEAIARHDGARVRRIYRAALSVFLSVGLLGTVVMLCFAKQFCILIRSENAYGCILSIAPTVFFVCLSSALRGYFQGYQRMAQTAVSQILEALGKLVFGLLLAYYARIMGYQTATIAAFAGLGLTLGAAVSSVYLLWEKRRFHKKVANRENAVSAPALGKGQHIWGRLAALSIPMTLGAALVSLTKLVDMAMILRRLQSIGLSAVDANEAYGSYTTLALSVYGLLPSLVNAVALPLVPMLSAAIASGERERQAQMVRTSYRLTALFAIPAALGITAFSRPILSLLFGYVRDAVDVAAPLLSYLGISVFLSCMITASNSVLHAYQSVNRPIFSMLAGAVVKLVSAYFLIGNPSIALAGAPISTLLCNTTVVLLNLHFASRLAPGCEIKSVFLSPLIASSAAIGISYAAYLTLTAYFGAAIWVTLTSLLLTAFMYLLLCCVFGIFDREDLQLLPLGKHICKFLSTLRLLPPQR